MAIDKDLTAIVLSTEGVNFCGGLDVAAFLSMTRLEQQNHAHILAQNAR